MTTVIIEDCLLFRQVLVKLAKDLHLDCVGEAGDGEDAIKIVAATQPDLVLLDLQMPKLDGFDVARLTRLHSPRTRILAISAFCDEHTVFCVEKAHLHGFVLKNSDSFATLAEAVAAISHGGTYFSVAFRQIRAACRTNPAASAKLLTDREREILILVGTPMTDHEIAQRLGLSAGTVERHRFNLLRKLDLRSTVELIRYAQTHGFTHFMQSRTSV